MNKMEINVLVDQLREGTISRRGFMRRATALGVSAGAAGMLARSAAAQTPVATPAGDVIKNAVTREEAMAAINSAFPFEEAGTWAVRSSTSRAPISVPSTLC